MKVYRGDKIFNKKTEPGRYRNNGIRSKAFGGDSNPENINRHGLLESIRKHTKPITGDDFGYYSVTDFISFSRNEERAKYWCSDEGTLVLNKCDEFQETRYVFKMDLNDSDITYLVQGIYLFTYKCNPELKTSDSNNLMTNLVLGMVEPRCDLCSETGNFHYLVLIDSFEYLKSYSQHERYVGAIENARKDEEYLLLPFDKLQQNFLKTRIPRADFWTVDHYNVVGEKRPSVDYL